MLDAPFVAKDYENYFTSVDFCKRSELFNAIHAVKFVPLSFHVTLL